jgi:hypothetical protein
MVEDEDTVIETDPGHIAREAGDCIVPQDAGDTRPEGRPGGGGRLRRRIRKPGLR